MSQRRQIVYPVSSLRKRLDDNAVDQLRQYGHLFRPVIEWLEERASGLKAGEDAQGSFRDDCPNHLHVRAMKGARMDCDDVIQELREVVFPERK